jgi:hypothetical protein
MRKEIGSEARTGRIIVLLLPVDRTPGEVLVVVAGGDAVVGQRRGTVVGLLKVLVVEHRRHGRPDRNLFIEFVGSAAAATWALTVAVAVDETLRTRGEEEE